MTTLTGVNDDNDYGYATDEDAVDSIVANWEDADDEDDQLSEQDDEDTTDSDETAEDDGDEEETGGSDEDADGEDGEDGEGDGPQPTKAGDDALVEITIDGKVETVKVADLKRLYGQEASLTRKSQEVSEARKAAETKAAEYEQGLNAVVEVVKRRYEEYEKLNWLVLTKELSAEDLQTLSEQAAEARADYLAVTSQVAEHQQKKDHEYHQAMAAAAKAAIQALNDPASPYHIQGWNSELYADLRTFAVQNGLPPDEVSNIVSPAVIKLLWKARQFDKANSAVKTKKKTVKKVLKTKSQAAANSASDKATKAFARLQHDGSDDAAMEALLSRWG